MDRKRRRAIADSNTDANNYPDTQCYTDSYAYRDTAAYSDAQGSPHTEAAPNCFSSSIRLRRSSSKTGVVAIIPP